MERERMKKVRWWFDWSRRRKGEMERESSNDLKRCQRRRDWWTRSSSVGKRRLDNGIRGNGS